jgi:SAM-dependent methyltransferase
LRRRSMNPRPPWLLAHEAIQGDDPVAVDPIQAAINGAHAFCEEQQAALDKGFISEEQWYESHKKHFSSIYLASGNPRGQSGHSGDEARYDYTQEMILAAIEADGTFLDVGCANGYLLEKLEAWSRERGHALECHGLDISEELIELAKRRVPRWKDRFSIGNALHWMPEKKFRYVLVKELDYVPRSRRKEFFLHLLNDIVEPGGRLILGPWTEPVGAPGIEEETTSWGYPPIGSCTKPHQDHESLARKVFWYDVRG